MPILKNQKHEIFAQSLATGASARKAYSDAGYTDNRKNAWRLKTNKDIIERVLEIQHASAKSAEITIQSVCAELDSAIQVARARGQANAMVSAAGLRAKLAGLMVERHEIGAPSDFSDCRTESEIVDALLVSLAGDEPVTFSDQDRAKAAELVLGMRDQLVELVASCSAKPVNAVNPAEHKKIRADRQRLLGGNSGRRY